MNQIIRTSLLATFVALISSHLADTAHAGEPAFKVIAHNSVAVDSLSKATLSRFAGTKWSAQTDSGRASFVPDLWRNTARTLAGHPDFVVAAKEAGVWQQVQVVLSDSSRSTPA